MAQDHDVVGSNPMPGTFFHARLAQLAVALGRGPKCWGFKSLSEHFFDVHVPPWCSGSAGGSGPPSDRSIRSGGAKF